MTKPETDKQKRSGADYIAYNDGLDYWTYIYTSLHVQCYFEGDLNYALEKLSTLTKYQEEDMYTLRCMLNAIHNDMLGREFSYDLTSLSHEEMQAAREIHIFASQALYYPWDINNCPSGEALALFTLENKGLPTPPPLLVTNDSTQKMAVSRGMHSDVTFCVSEDFKQEMSQVTYSPCVTPAHESFNEEDFIKEVRYNTSRIRILNKRSDNNVTSDEKQQFAKKRKDIENTPYRAGRGDWERIVGLILFDLYSLYQGATFEELSRKFEEMDLYDTINSSFVFKKKDPTLTGREPWVQKRWMDTTIQSIQKRKVIPISK